MIPSNVWSTWESIVRSAITLLLGNLYGAFAFASIIIIIISNLIYRLVSPKDGDNGS